MDNILLLITQIAGCITAIMTAAAVLIKPFRERLFNSKKANDGEKCLLRCEILNIYYRNKDKEEIHQYELENLIQLNEAYKALGGNSFVGIIYDEMLTWEVIR